MYVGDSKAHAAAFLHFRYLRHVRAGQHLPDAVADPLPEPLQLFVEVAQRSDARSDLDVVAGALKLDQKGELEVEPPIDGCGSLEVNEVELGQTSTEAPSLTSEPLISAGWCSSCAADARGGPSMLPSTKAITEGMILR